MLFGDANNINFALIFIAFCFQCVHILLFLHRSVNDASAAYNHMDPFRNVGREEEEEEEEEGEARYRSANCEKDWILIPFINYEFLYLVPHVIYNFFHSTSCAYIAFELIQLFQI